MAAIFFDLDGTLTDSSEGITKCAQLALRHFGIQVEDRTTLTDFIGPPLRETFPKRGVPSDRVEEAVTVFRQRYLTVGKFENTPYPGIREMLEALKNRGFSLYVATSKPEETAKEILEKFELAPYFDVICGADMAGLRDEKDKVIAWLLSQIPRDETIVMVGDTDFDVLGAKAHGIPCIGVTWGFGSREGMEKAGAVSLVETPEALVAAIISLTRNHSDIH